MLTVKTRQREFRGPQPGSVAILGRSTAKYPIDKIIQDRRKEEDARNEVLKRTKEEDFLMMRSDWERNTDKRIQHNTVRRRVEHKLREHEVELEDRRDKLQALLLSEHNSFMDEMRSGVKTTLDRQAEMRERAKFLKNQREEERLKFVNEKLEQQWRDSNEELRTTLVKKYTKEISKENYMTAKMKSQGDPDKKFMDVYFAKLWEEELQKKVDRENRDSEAARTRNMEQLKGLQEQKAALVAKKAEEAKYVIEEARLLEELKSLQKLEDMRAAQEKYIQQQATKQMLDNTIKMKMRREAKEYEEELAFDMKILDQLVEEAKAEASEEIARKRRLQEEQRRYREHLKIAQAEREAKEKELERLCDIEVEKQWKARLEQWDREKKARKKLLREVIEARKLQIEYKIHENEERKKEAEIEKQRIMDLINKNRELDIRDKDARHTKDMKYGEELNSQISYNKHLRDLEREERQREEAAIIEARRREQQRIDDALQVDWVDPKAHPLRKAAMLNKDFY